MAYNQFMRNVITATSLAAFRSCQRKLYNNAHRYGEQAPLSEIGELVVNKGVEYETSIIAALDTVSPQYEPGRFRQAAEDTKRLMMDTVLHPILLTLEV